MRKGILSIRLPVAALFLREFFFACLWRIGDQGRCLEKLTPMKKTDGHVSWVGSISDDIYYNGPIAFSRQRLAQQAHLFAHRAALFYTPTESIPSSFIGSGMLDTRLPVPTPDATEFGEIKAYAIPRFWVDLIQRQTQRIRWTPISRARVVFTRYDCFTIREDHLAMGSKALLDALKVQTMGRRNGRRLYYFGAIIDDGPGFVEVSWHQEVVGYPRDAGVRIQVFSQDGG